MRGQRDRNTNAKPWPFPRAVGPVAPDAQRRRWGWRGLRSGGPSALFTWSQRRGQAGRVSGRVGDTGRLRLPARPSRDSEAASGVFARGPLAARKDAGSTTDSVSGNQPSRPSFIIRRTGRRGVTSLPAVAQRKRSPVGCAAGTFVPALRGGGCRDQFGRGYRERTE